MLIQLRVRSHAPRCYSESVVVTLLTFLVPSEVIGLVVGQLPSPLVFFTASPSRRRSKPGPHSRVSIRRGVAEPRRALQTPMRFLTFCSLASSLSDDRSRQRLCRDSIARTRPPPMTRISDRKTPEVDFSTHEPGRVPRKRRIHPPDQCSPSHQPTMTAETAEVRSSRDYEQGRCRTKVVKIGRAHV